jgi:hypothetical protein
MKAKLTRILLAATLASGAVFAQNTDFGLLDGFTPCGTCPPGTAVQSFQMNYARQVLETPAGGLYLEFPLILGNTNPAGNVAIFFAPGVRFKLATQSRLSYYGVAGVGIASFGGTAVGGRTVSGTVDFGGGIDVRLTRHLSVRGEARDFVTRSGLGGFRGRNHPIFSVGIGLHF